MLYLKFLVLNFNYIGRFILKYKFLDMSFTCQYFKNEFNDSKDYDVHCKIKHRSQFSEPVSCAYYSCGRLFGIYERMKKHLFSTHNKEKSEDILASKKYVFKHVFK